MTAVQSKIKRNPAEHLRPWQFQPGQSGNPSGKPKGTKSLKEYAKEMLRGMTNEEKLKFMKGLNKDDIWRMAEGNPKTDLGADVTLTTKIISVDE